MSTILGLANLKFTIMSSCSMPDLEVLMQLGLTVLSNLAATSEGAALLLKSPLLTKTEQQLHHLLQRREGPRTAALLGPLVNLAAHTEGQKQILRAASAPGPPPSPAPPSCMHHMLLSDAGNTLYPASLCCCCWFMPCLLPNRNTFCSCNLDGCH